MSGWWDQSGLVSRRRKSEPGRLLQLIGEKTPGGGRGVRPSNWRRRSLVRGCCGSCRCRGFDFGLLQGLELLDPFEPLSFGLFLLFLLALQLLLLLPELLRWPVKVRQFGVPLVMCPESSNSGLVPFSSPIKRMLNVRRSCDHFVVFISPNLHSVHSNSRSLQQWCQSLLWLVKQWRQ